MKPRATFMIVWMVTGFAAVVCSILGGAAGKTFLFAGAVVGGLIGAAIAVAVATRFNCLPKTSRRNATVGAMIGFAIAAPIAATNLHTPVIPVLICSLSGAGALFGAGRARR
jgi:hypothetical protein